MSANENLFPKCKCGCGQLPAKTKRGDGWLKYAEGHQYNKSARATASGVPPLCKCSCGQRVNRKTRFGKWWNYLEGHRGAGHKYQPIDSVAPKCACGCGDDVVWHVQNKAWNTYIRGHSSRTQEGRNRARQQALDNWADPAIAMRIMVGFRAIDPKVAEKRRANHLIAVQSPEFRAKASKRLKDLWQQPDFREM